MTGREFFRGLWRGLDVLRRVLSLLLLLIFFGLLGSQSGPAATAVAPQLRSGLAAVGAPAAAAGHVEGQFRQLIRAIEGVVDIVL